MRLVVQKFRGGCRALLLFGTAIGAALTAATPACAGGFYLQEQSVRGLGRANSGEVADQGPASLWWNPAAIGDGANGLSLGAAGIFPSGRVDDRGTTITYPGPVSLPVGGVADQRDPLQQGLLPDGAAAFGLGHHVAVGLAVTSPYSFTSHYPANGWQRYSALRTRLRTFDLQPSIAWSPVPMLSLGAALNAEYADAQLGNALPNLSPLLPDGQLQLKGNGWNYGWSAGAQLHAPGGIGFGIAYKSAITHKLSGTVAISGLLGPLAGSNMSASTTARFTTPWQLIVGARAPVGGALTLNAQVVRFGWSRFDAIRVAAPLNQATVENYRDTWSVAFGVDARVNPLLTLRAGIQFDQTPTRDGFRDARVPDGARADFNIGASLQATHALAVDAGAGYTHVGSSPIDRPELFYAGTPAQTGIATDGRQTNQRAVVLGLGARLGF
jgi:long-chain fatty acid transport protein